MTTQPTLFGAGAEPPKSAKGRCPICARTTQWERLYERHYRCMDCRAGIVAATWR